MGFHTRTLRKNPPRKPIRALQKGVMAISARQWKMLWSILLILLGVLVMLRLAVGAYHFVANFSFKNLIVTTLGADLKKDEYGYTNLAILGDGGHERDGADLVDTLMVASIDWKKKAVSILSIPRDFYIQNGTMPAGRINTLYVTHKHLATEDERFGAFSTGMGELVNLSIHYYMRVDFAGFVSAVDALGGIRLEVKEDLYDPYYPNADDDGYTLFRMKKGIQEMDGETALKFVRSRKTTSDFDRAARQQQVMEAIRQKALSAKVLSNPKTLTRLYESIQNNLNTNLSLTEMISLAGFAQNFDRTRLVTRVLHDDPSREGGFLVTPERELYGGQFVLVPYGKGYDLIHRYANLLFHHRELFYAPPKLHILNATRRSGLANQLAAGLSRYGFSVERVGNYQDAAGERQTRQQSLLVYYDWDEKDGAALPVQESAIQALLTFFRAQPVGEKRPTFDPEDESLEVTEQTDQSFGLQEGAPWGPDLTVILGEDYEFLF